MKPTKLINKERHTEKELWSHAEELIPRGTMTMSKCHDQFSDNAPFFADFASGAYIRSLDGKSYLDYGCSLGPIILGYNHPRTNNAIERQLRKGVLFTLPTILEQELAELVVEAVPCVEQVRFAKNGSDVTLAAVRIARAYTNREHIIKCGYHGWGDWHGITIRPYGIPTCLKNIISEFEYNNLESLEKELQSHEVAAVIMEAQALTPPKPGFLEGVRDLTHKYGALLIFDEVVTGFRWALGGAQQHYGVIPDIATLGKAMGNGMPIAAIGGKKEYMQELNHCFFSMTFGGECLSIAAAIETIKELQEKDYGQLWRLGDKLSDGLKKSAEKYGLKINYNGSGPRHSLIFSDEYINANELKDLFAQEMMKRNILWGNVVLIQFSHTDHDIDMTINAADESFKIVAENQNKVDVVYKGNHSATVFRKNT